MNLLHFYMPQQHTDILSNCEIKIKIFWGEFQWLQMKYKDIRITNWNLKTVPWLLLLNKGDLFWSPLLIFWVYSTIHYVALTIKVRATCLIHLDHTGRNCIISIDSMLHKSSYHILRFFYLFLLLINFCLLLLAHKNY